jgi:5,10-methylenetetrahydromethanopterin reductase
VTETYPIGLVVGSTVAPEVVMPAAKAAEAAGFDSLWTTEDYFLTGGVATSALALAATSRITVGVGLLSVYARHPALTAMETATLARAFPGRFILGLGPGVFGWLDQMGIAHRAPLKSMRESIETVRSLLAGEKLTGGEVFPCTDVVLEYPAVTPPPIYAGAIGPKMLAQSAAVAEGTLLSVLAGPAYVRHARELTDGSAPAHRDLVALAIFSLDEDVEAARAAARPVVATYLAATGANALTDAEGISEELTGYLAKGGQAELEASMPDSWIDRLSVCGDPKACAEAISALRAAGADSVALLPVSAEGLVPLIETVGSTLLPLVRKATAR